MQFLFLVQSVRFRQQDKKTVQLGPNHYFIKGRSPSETLTEVLHLAGALIEHFLEGYAPLSHWHIYPNEKSNKYKYSLPKSSTSFNSRKCSIKASAKCKTSIYLCLDGDQPSMK